MGKIPETRKHRHIVSVTTEDVMACAKRFPRGWTISDMAASLGVTERAVRAAVQWLSAQRAVKALPVSAERRRCRVKVYIISCGERCNVLLLNRIVMRWAA